MRALPSGPTVADEMANAAFFLGLMSALDKEYGEVSGLMPFDDAKDNFFAAARYGLKAQFTWVDGKRHTASGLILDHLLPLARKGLSPPLMVAITTWTQLRSECAAIRQERSGR